VRAARWAHFSRRLRGRAVVYGLLAGAALGIAAGAFWHNRLAALVVGGMVTLAILLFEWEQAEEEAEREFFTSFAPSIGLEYVVSGALPPITPLLSAGDAQLCKNVMEGPLFGAQGGPTCTFAQYEFRVTHAEGEGSTRTVSHHFTICALEVPGALPVFHGVFLRRRPQIRVDWLWDDWLKRVHAKEVDLESTDFEQRYELRTARDQDPMVVHELFSPSFIVWLTEHPLRPGFECKAGELVVFIPGHEGSAGDLTLLFEATREITSRVMAAVAAVGSPTAAA
jgi:hypothetical protein